MTTSPGSNGGRAVGNSIEGAPNRGELPPDGAPPSLWELRCVPRRSRQSTGSRGGGAVRVTRGGVRV
eukprot:4033004-Alexandrium_andersonii.AAC.2